jgi:hypothetical protein
MLNRANDLNLLYEGRRFVKLNRIFFYVHFDFILNTFLATMLAETSGIVKKQNRECLMLTNDKIIYDENTFYQDAVVFVAYSYC